MIKKLLIVAFLLSVNTAFAQEEKPATTICEASESCQEACKQKTQIDHDDNNSKYQKLLLKCAEDVARNSGLF